MLFSLLFFQWMRNQYRSQETESKIAWRAQLILTLLSIIDLIQAYIREEYNYVAAMIRPFLLLTQFRVLRNNFYKFLVVLLQALPMFLFILIFVVYYSWMLNRMFSGTVQGVQYFDGFGNGFYSMLVLMTTANYPDVMLPAYQLSCFNCLFFIVFLLMTKFLF